MSVPEKYRAVKVTGYGAAVDTLQLVEVEPSTPKKGEVLVKVAYTSVNPVDAKLRCGGMKNLLPLKFPSNIGFDLSGEVVAVGPNVTTLKVGDMVYGGIGPHGLARGGSYAEYTIVKESDLCKNEHGISHADAVGLNIAGLTAYFAVVEKAKVKEGMTVLINGASGGVGTYAVQIAKAKGARVIGTCSAANADFVKSLGADETIDYRETSPREAVEKFTPDALVDLVGGEEYWKAMKAVVGRKGYYVTAVGPEEHAGEKGINPVQLAGLAMSTIWRMAAGGLNLCTGYKLIVYLPKEKLHPLGQMVKEGKVKTVVAQEITLDDIVKGHEAIESHRTRGKILVKVSDLTSSS